MSKIAEREQTVMPDHRVEMAARKRAQMRARLLEATMRVFAHAGDRVPVIEDVVREANVSRGTFYLHFVSLDDALHTVSLTQSDQMTREILPIYDLLKEPWQRFSTGFRLFLKRAYADPVWASFVTRTNTTNNKLLVRDYMARDLELGQSLEQFSFNNLEVAVDFMLGASSAGVAVLGTCVKDAETYMDEYLRMALVGLGCSGRQCERGVEFSRKYLEGWKIGLLPNEAASDRGPRTKGI